MSESTSRSGPTGLLRLFFKVPALLYRIGLGRFLGSRMITITTVGRKTGQRRVTALNYGRDGFIVYVLVGYGPRSDWYRNLVKNPSVEVQIGSRHYPAQARTVTDSSETARAVRLVSQSDHGPPGPIRPFLKSFLGLDYDAEASRAFEHPEEILAVALELDEG